MQDNEEDLRLFVGDKYGEYRRKWRLGSRWNWPAALLDMYWLLYRKMYAYCVLFILAAILWTGLLATLFQDVRPTKAMIAVMVALALIPKLALALMANKLYWHHATEKIAAVRNAPLFGGEDEERLRAERIAQAGGTTLPVPLTAFAAPLLIVGLSATIYMLQQSKRTVEALDREIELASARDQDAWPSETDGVRYSPPASGETGPTDEWEGAERVNVLFIGGDARRRNELPRADSMIVVSLDPKDKQAALLTILRDTYVELPGHGRDTIGNALAVGGPGLSVRAAEELTGLTIPYYVYADMAGFAGLVDALGGVDLNVEKDMTYADSHDDPIYDIDLRQGAQHLDGNEALQYVRYRHDALSDFARTERQRRLLMAIGDRLHSAATLAQAPELIAAVAPYVETNIGAQDLLKLAMLGLRADASAMTGFQLPPMEQIEERAVGAKTVLAVRDEDGLRQYVEEALQ